MTGNQLARFLSSVLEGGGSTLTFERPDNVSWALDVREALGVIDGLIAHATSLDDQVQELDDELSRRHERIAILEHNLDEGRYFHAGQVRELEDRIRSLEGDRDELAERYRRLEREGSAW